VHKIRVAQWRGRQPVGLAPNQSIQQAYRQYHRRASRGGLAKTPLVALPQGKERLKKYLDMRRQHHQRASDVTSDRRRM
jgi:hypothetical protein